MPIQGRDQEFIATISILYHEELGREPDSDGLAAWLDQCRNGMTGDQLRQALHDSPEGVAYRTRPVVPPVPYLEVRGDEFVDAQGQRISLRGCDGFLDYRFWLDAREDKVEPIMQESIDLGFNCRRIFLAGDAIENQVFTIHPKTEENFYSQLSAFVAFENAHGIIPLLTVNVDMQRVMPDAGDRLRHWQTVNAWLRGKGLVYLMSGGNQWSKNGFNPWTDVDDPGPGVIWSRGSDVDDTKVAPRGATASELHSTRVSWDRSIMDAAASPINMRANGGAMVWMTEGIPIDQNSDPFILWQLGRIYATCWALAIAHDRQGQRGLLRTGRIRESCAAFADGMRI
jgi:hypothetical protein